VAQLARGLATRGHSVLLLINKRGGAFADTLSHPNIQLVEFGRMSRYDVRVLGDIARGLRLFRADVLLCVGFNATFWGRLAAIGLRTPVITAEHESVRQHRRYGIPFANWLLGSFTHTVVACASAQKPYLIAECNPAEKIVVIPNGVDPARFRPERERGASLRRAWGIPKNATLVGIVAAHRAEKRHDVFVRLVENCSADANVYGVMVGDGALIERNRDVASASPAAGRLVVAGPVQDMPAAYSACDVIVLTSDAVEVFPLSFLEAQACGVPVVGFALCGVPETMQDGATGYSIAPGDEAGMAQRVLELSRDPSLRESMGVAGRAWVAESLTVDSMVSAYEVQLDRAANTLRREASARCIRAEGK
jgi:glycosyltransferase involved in cell wall biosynthesis